MTFKILSQHPANAVLGEAPLWDPSRQVFLWLDLLGRKVHRFDPETGSNRVIVDEFSENLACLVRLTDGLVLLVTASKLFRLDSANGKLGEVESPLVPENGTCFNDGKVAPDGSLWLGISDALEKDGIGSLHRISAAGTICVDQGFVVSNGPAFSPDGKAAFFADTMGRSILEYSLDQDGTPGENSVFARIPEEAGYPDGMTVDRDGNLYSAHWAGGRITKYDKEGRIAGIIEFPAKNVTSCAFGGEDCSLLFVTTAALEDSTGPDSPHGDIFVLSGTARGLPEPRFNPDILC